LAIERHGFEAPLDAQPHPTLVSATALAWLPSWTTVP
jgi:hypothetical protein